MAVTNYNAPHADLHRSKVAGAFHHLFAAVSAWNDARVTRNALSRLSDRELNDIGLCRGDIEDAARR